MITLRQAQKLRRLIRDMRLAEFSVGYDAGTSAGDDGEGTAPTEAARNRRMADVRMRRVDDYLTQLLHARHRAIIR